jgi:hypothetical protein
MKKKFIVVTVFAVAMGFMESSIVIYLRELMYPDGFSFPLTPIMPDIALTEVLREAATIIMLICIGFIAGKTAIERFAWFIFSFAIWDIFYYVFLKLLIDWPASFMTWDILFLIPATWVGPVITPVIVSLSMILLAVVILSFTGKGFTPAIKGIEWAWLITGSLILILGFIWDYSKYMMEFFSFREIFILPSKTALFDQALQYIPESFNWFLFVSGQGVIVLTTIRIYFRLKRE